jgi:protein-tyrosine phosphatase
MDTDDNYNNYHNYDMITDNVAIGDHTSSYDPFDVIVNLNYPYNNVEHHVIKFDNYNKDKLLIRVGTDDRPDENMYLLLQNLLPELLKIYYHNPNTKFLFHCYAGISRSSSVAIAFLASIHNTSPSEIFHFAKRKRPVINPNKGFENDLIRYFTPFGIKK